MTGKAQTLGRDTHTDFDAQKWKGRGRLGLSLTGEVRHEYAPVIERSEEKSKRSHGPQMRGGGCENRIVR